MKKGSNFLPSIFIRLCTLHYPPNTEVHILKIKFNVLNNKVWREEDLFTML